MAGFLVPPWYQASTPSEASINLAAFVWGFFIAVAAFSLVKASWQTYRILAHSGRPNAYIIMVWLEWSCNILISTLSWLFLRGHIEPSFWIFFGLLCLWVVQVQCIAQIIINRISLIMYNPQQAIRLKWTVGLVLGLICTSVFCIWIPARLQISPTYIRVNNIWDRVEKVLFLLIDAGLNTYFVYLVKSRLISNGLTKYNPLFRFNLAMVFVSISLDVVIIGVMSLSDDTIYIQFHPLVYMIKLHIEMNMADLIARIVRASNNASYPHCLEDSTAFSWDDHLSPLHNPRDRRPDSACVCGTYRTVITADHHKSQDEGEAELRIGAVGKKAGGGGFGMKGIQKTVETDVRHFPAPAVALEGLGITYPQRHWEAWSSPSRDAD